MAMLDRIYEILIVDDAKTMRMIVQAVLASDNVHFEHAENGQEAYEAVIKKRFDVIITDIHMPIMTGLEFCSKVRNELKFKNLPILVMTTDHSYDTVEKVFQSGATDFITKPINELELNSRVKRILEQSRIEKELYIAQNAAVQANQRKSEYLANVNHELKTPLNGIYGYSQILQTIEEDPEKLEMVDMIVKASEQMTSMINQLLELEQIESGKVRVNKQPINMMDMVQGCLSMFDLQLKDRNIRVDSNVDSSIIVQTDKHLFHSVISNLVSNAMKYNKPAGRIIIDARNVNGSLRLDIKDTGIGMTPRQVEHIYEPFSRFSDQNLRIEGHGLGMAITKSTADALDIAMSIDSEVDRGTRISLTFH